MFKTVLKSNVKRYWWICVLNILVLAVLYIFPIEKNLEYYYLSDMIHFYSLLFGALNGWAVFSYLHNERAVAMLHSMPSTRNKIFAANLCFGAASTLLPQLFLAVALPAATSGIPRCDPDVCFGYIFLHGAVYGLTMLSLGCFTSMFTGNAVAAGVFIPVLTVLPFYIESIVYVLNNEYLYGSGRNNYFISDTMTDPNFTAVSLTIFVCLIIGLTIGAYIAYRRRAMEAAGEIVTFRWAKGLFVQGCAVCFGFLLCSFINGCDPIIAAAIIGVVTIAAALMVLQKTYRIKGFFRHCAVFVCIMAALFAVYKFDLTGYEARVPKADKVESVEFRYWGHSETITDRQVIAAIIADHEKIARAQPDGFGGDYSLVYNLRGNRHLSRNYTDGDYSYFAAALMSEEFKNGYFGMNEDWTRLRLSVCEDSSRTFNTFESYSADDFAEVKEALAKDLAVCGVEDLYNDIDYESKTINLTYFVSVEETPDNDMFRAAERETVYGNDYNVSPAMTNTYAVLEELLEAKGEETIYR